MIPIIGISSAIGGSAPGAEEGPLLLQTKFEFTEMLYPEKGNLYQNIAKAVSDAVKTNPFVIVVEGDHSSAIGTWSGAHDALGEIGLIWLDAHMDCHTEKTSHTKNIHGMPLAALLGYGKYSLGKKIKPENLFLVGTRSFEDEEKAFAEEQKITCYPIEEVKKRTLATVLKEIIAYFKKRNIAYGVSLDIDFFDPALMPATNTPEKNGLDPDLFCKSSHLFSDYPPRVFEYAEFTPKKDIDNKSLLWSKNILDSVLCSVKK